MRPARPDLQSQPEQEQPDRSSAVEHDRGHAGSRQVVVRGCLELLLGGLQHAHERVVGQVVDRPVGVEVLVVPAASPRRGARPSGSGRRRRRSPYPTSPTLPLVRSRPIRSPPSRTMPTTRKAAGTIGTSGPAERRGRKAATSMPSEEVGEHRVDERDRRPDLALVEEEVRDAEAADQHQQVEVQDPERAAAGRRRGTGTARRAGARCTSARTSRRSSRRGRGPSPSRPGFPARPRRPCRCGRRP